MARRTTLTFLFIPMTSTLPPLVQAVSGAIGSASANTLTYPFDLVTTRLQLEKGHRKETGLRRAFHVLYGILRKTAWRPYMMDFQRIQSQRCCRTKPAAHHKPGSVYKPTIVEELVLGFVAGVASRAVSMPMNIVTLRLQTGRGDSETDSDNTASDLTEEETATPSNNSDSESGLRSVFASIYREEGLAGFWKGMLPDVRKVVDPAIPQPVHIFGVVPAISPRSSCGEKNPTSHALPNASPKRRSSVALSQIRWTRLQASTAESLHEVIVDSYTGTYHRHPSQYAGNSLPLPANTKPLKAGSGRVSNLYQALPSHLVKGFLNQGMTFLVKGRIEALIVHLYLARLPRR
ncbi:oxidation resistance protein [Salix suchowensis]|nr:oxidation resistance protein [Salix suchowensis]